MRTLLAVLVAAAVLAGCGVPGAPLPPSLHLPRPVDDLKAYRKGDRVTLTWTTPSETTDRAGVKQPGPIRICRSLPPAMAQCAQAVGELMPGFFPPGQPASYVDTLPIQLQQENETGFATYAVESLNARGRSAGLSNQVQVPLAPTLAPPVDLRGGVAAEGVVLSWSAQPHPHDAPGVAHFFRVYRRLEGSERDAVAGEVTLATDPQASFTDRSFEWEKRYLYRVTPVTRLERDGRTILIEGDDSAPVTVFTHDTFPPAVPAGVQAVYSGLAQQKFIDLTWAPVTDADLAGYNVYRREQGGTPVKLNPAPVTAPAFRDADLQPGRTYFYSVAAVDSRGNESARSPEASEQVPQ